MPGIGIGIGVPFQKSGINWSSYWKTQSALWLEADAVTGLADGDAVSTWPDQSPNGNNATQTGTNRPVYKVNIVNGKPVIRFTKASAHYLNLGTAASLDIGNNVTIITVYKTTIPTTRQTILGSNGAANALQLEQSVNSNSAPNIIIEGEVISAAYAETNAIDFDIVVYRRNGAGANHLWDIGGVPIYHALGSASNYSATGYTKGIGRRSAGDAQYFDGDLAALIQFNETLSDADLLVVEKLLSDKYNLGLDYENSKADFTIVGIPDTQDYTADAGGQLVANAMIQFIADKRISGKIGMVLQVGDFTTNCAADRWAMWDSSFASFPITILPYLAALGNHDYDGGSCSRTNTTVWDARYPTSFYTGKAWWNGGFYEVGKTQNVYFNITLGGQDYMFITLEFGPRQGAIDWANALIQANPTKKVIILTHVYSYSDGTRLGTGDTYNPHTLVNPDVDVHDGDELWTELVSLAANDNVTQVWSGHDSGFFGTKVTGIGGNTILEILDAHAVGDFKIGAVMMASFYLSANKVLLTAHNPATGFTFYRKMIDVT